MEHRIIAERTEPGGDSLKEWHMVREGERTAMCGREIDPMETRLPPEAWGTEEAKPFCHSCGALFLRESP
ncbi:hypothetical protein [Streptomyces sp. NPDC046939]|uniref:hypothetical protein n=1 Tax=Streptomyces sp. NPDC046939 TaxID=3155376 RepID=UPI0034088EB5